MDFHITQNPTPFYNCSFSDPLAAVVMTTNDPYVENDQRYILYSSHFPYSFIGDDFSLEIQQQQSEIDRFITHHMEKVRKDLTERHYRHENQILATIKEEMMKHLMAKEEEIEKIQSLNFALEEKVRSLCIENQMWRNLATSNEATANALRINLNQVLEQVGNDQQFELAEDAISCCDSNEADERVKDHNKSRSCRNCGEEEACVLLLPCRHLCLCSKCSRKYNACPVCKANKNISVHVNIS